MNFDQAYREQRILEAIDQERVRGQPEQFASGTISALDMSAPKKAVRKLREATTLLAAKKAKDAIQRLQKAIEIYPKFVSAHIVLGLAYFDMKDDRARDEFETATRLDDQFAVSHMYLGMMSLWSNDFGAADASLEKAALLSPNDPRILNALAFAENGAHKYSDVLRTVQQIHRLQHEGMGDVHYVAAAAALSLHDINTGKTELNTFLSEEPTGPLSAIARQALGKLGHSGNIATPSENFNVQPLTISTKGVSAPNTPRLKSELREVAASADPADESELSLEPSIIVDRAPSDKTAADAAALQWSNEFTIRQAVDETALFLAISQHGKMVNDLTAADIKIRDDNRPPDRILQFLPQSKLPLRLGVLIDTSDSVEHRLAFEKRAAKKFLDTVLNPESDLAFVAGFDTGVDVTQDFTADSEALGQGVDHMSRHGEGTAVFDAVHFASWKLAAFPDEQRVARVLVILTDGEDNASHRTLKDSIEAAEAAGIAVYTFNTSQDYDTRTDANAVLQVIAQRSGGESVFSRDMSELERFFNKLSEAIRSRYLIAYKPANFVADGSYRKLSVTAEKDGKPLQVHVRKGYYARLAAHE